MAPGRHEVIKKDFEYFIQIIRPHSVVLIKFNKLSEFGFPKALFPLVEEVLRKFGIV